MLGKDAHMCHHSTGKKYFWTLLVKAISLRSDSHEQDEGSNVDITINNDKLEKGKEVKLGIGQNIKFGNDEFQVPSFASSLIHLQ